MKLQFISKAPLLEYHSSAFDFYPGDEKEVPEVEAERLLEDFPENFKRVSGEKVKKGKEEKKIKGSRENKGRK